MRWGVAVILAAAIGGSAEAASEPCSLRAYAVGEELTIRAAASEDSVTLAAVPAEFAEAEVREEHQGWLRVASIEDAESGQMLFEGTGWVSVGALALSISGAGNRILYTEPNEDSRAVLLGLGGGESPDLVGCSGRWARVRFGDDTGWLAPSGQCSSALTTCN